MRKIDIGSCTRAEFAVWLDEYVAAVEDGSEKAEMDAKLEAKLGPEWVARYGDAAWDAALVVSGFCSSWDPILTHPSPPPKPKGGS
jgi:hypothetical protein